MSLLRDDHELGSWVGTKSVSKAEEILEEIERLLANNQINKNEISQIAVSIDGGSATGLRIGYATALGLKKAVGCSIVDVPILDCIAAEVKSVGKFLVAVSGNNRNIYSQCFELDSDSKIIAISSPEMMTFDKFLHSVASHQPVIVAVNKTFSHFLDSENVIESKLFNAGDNLALLVGREAIRAKHG